jgi:serine/threonine-protein kinase
MPHHSSLPPPHTIVPGTRLGRYEIIAELGTGGMATVYLGRALSVAGFQRLVAIKYLHPHLLKDETFVQMFLDEGRLAARIHHPNVVGTLDLVHESDGLYIVSEYIEGDQLLSLFRAARDQNGRIPVGITVRIMLDILGGLHAAHELVDDLGASLKLVHRDVSPQNILVGADGISRITDFGIAKAEERIANTRDGIVKGKLSYMAPEQPNDLPIDRRTDVFSAATVLWECLTGRRLFPGKTDAEVLQGLLNKPILHLREIDPEYSTALDDVLAKALARNIDDRFDTASDFADALEVAAIPLGIATPREVARHVREIASEKLTEVKQRRRAMTTRDLPVFRGSSVPPSPSSGAPSNTPSGVHSIATVSAPPPPPAGDEAPTQLQTSPFAAESEAPRPSLPSLPRAAVPALPTRKTSRPDTPAPPLPTRVSDAPSEPAVPEPAATTLPSLVAPPPLDHLAVPPPPMDHLAVAPPPVDPEAPTLASITPPPASAMLVPEPLAFAPPPRTPSRAPAPTPSMPPRRSSRALLLLLVVGIGVVLGLLIYRFTAPEAPTPAASQPALTPTVPPAPAPPPMVPAPPPMVPAPAPETDSVPAPPPRVEETPRAVTPPRPAVNVRPVAPPRAPTRPAIPAAPAPRPSAETPAPTPPPAARESDLPTAI